MRASGVSLRFLASFGAHQHESGGAVIDARSVGCGHCSFLVEGGLQLRCVLDLGALADVLVLGHDGLALAGFHGDGSDLVLELAGPLGGLGLVLRGGGEVVLILAGDLPLAGDVLGGGAHVIAVEGIPQPVLDHGVDELERRPSSGRCANGQHAATWLMLSCPPATTMSASPLAICWVPRATARNPEPHTWFTPKAVASIGTPASTAACLAGFWPSPAVSTWPMITSSTSASVDACPRERRLDGDLAQRHAPARSTARR